MFVSGLKKTHIGLSLVKTNCVYVCILQKDIMVTEGEPTDLVKVLHLLVLSFTWGMQVWVSFIAGMRLKNTAAGLRYYTKQ